MSCEVIKLRDFTAVVCSRRSSRAPCRWCGRPHTKLCDFPLSGAKAGRTCNTPMCDRCATPIKRLFGGPDLDYCPPHARYSETLKTEKEKTDATL